MLLLTEIGQVLAETGEWPVSDYIEWRPDNYNLGANTVIARLPRMANGYFSYGLLRGDPSCGGQLRNCVKKYARAERLEDLLRPPQYRARVLDSYREIVRIRLNKNVPSARILAEIRAQGYTGASLLDRYVAQGRADAPDQAPSARRLTAWIMSRPSDLKTERRRHLGQLTGACLEMTAPAAAVRGFAVILTEPRGQDLGDRLNRTRAHKLPGFDQTRRPAATKISAEPKSI